MDKSNSKNSNLIPQQTQQNYQQQVFLQQQPQFHDYQQPEQNKKITRYDNDEEIKVEVYESKNEIQAYNLEDNMQLSLTSMTKAFKLSSTLTQQLPAQVSIKCSENKQETNQVTQNDRPSLDLICVIDNSGSMQGKKIELVQQALLSLLELLNEKDRIALVEFNSYGKCLLTLVTISKDNIPKIQNIINSIRANGGTDITSGMEIAFEILKQRRYINQVSSIFLLSDGQDKQAESKINSLLSVQYQQLSFTIQCFGFGQDHDGVLMSNISKLKDGGFYYVDKLDTVDEMFIDALGGLFSVVATDVQIVVKANKQNKKFADVNIQQTYGDFWLYDEKKNEYSIKLQQIIQGVSKDFLLDLEIPPMDFQVSDLERNTVLLDVSLSAKSIDKDQKIITKYAQLQITIYNENEQIVQEVDQNVENNIYRVRGAKAIQKAMQEADKGNYQQGQQILEKIQKQIDQTKPETKQKLSMLYNDIEECKKNCQEIKYNSGGKINMISNNRQHMEQRSKGCNQADDIYQNSMQCQMVQKKQMSKKK